MTDCPEIVEVIVPADPAIIEVQVPGQPGPEGPDGPAGAVGPGPVVDIGATHTLLSGEQNSWLRAVSGCVLTAPSGLTSGYLVVLDQAGAIPITVLGLTGGGVSNPLDHTQTSGPGAVAFLKYMPAVGAGAAYWKFGGQTAE